MNIITLFKPSRIAAEIPGNRISWFMVFSFLIANIFAAVFIAILFFQFSQVPPIDPVEVTGFGQTVLLVWQFLRNLIFVFLASYLLSKIFKLFKREASFWQVFNLYVYAKFWQTLIIIPIYIVAIYFILTDRSAPTPLFTELSAYLAGISIVLFYLMFGYCLSRILLKSTKK